MLKTINIQTGKDLIDLHIEKFEVINGAWIGVIQETNSGKVLLCEDCRGAVVNTIPLRDEAILDLTIKPLSHDKTAKNINLEKLNRDNKVLLGQALVSAHLNGDRVYFVTCGDTHDILRKTEEKEICMSDVLSVLDLEDENYEDFTDLEFKEIAELLKSDFAPDFHYSNHNELRIETTDKSNYPIWYFDLDEDRVYISNLKKYMKNQTKEQLQENKIEKEER